MPNAEFARELDPHRGYLLRVARLQLRDEALAEDVVQETLLAALSGSGFSGKSSLRTWLTGILKHKIVDAIRRKLGVRRHRVRNGCRGHRRDVHRAWKLGCEAGRLG